MGAAAMVKSLLSTSSASASGNPFGALVRQKDQDQDQTQGPHARSASNDVIHTTIVHL